MQLVSVRLSLAPLPSTRSSLPPWYGTVLRGAVLKGKHISDLECAWGLRKVLSYSTMEGDKVRLIRDNYDMLGPHIICRNESGGKKAKVNVGPSRIIKKGKFQK